LNLPITFSVSQAWKQGKIRKWQQQVSQEHV
jgi:hypothetical protein